MTSTFRQLPTYAIVKLSATTYQVTKNGKPMVIGSKANMENYLAKWDATYRPAYCAKHGITHR